MITFFSNKVSSFIFECCFYVWSFLFKEKGKKKSFLPVFSYDPLVGENSLTYERELTEFLEDEKGSGIVDVIGGSALVKREKSVYEFNLSTKKKKRLQKTDINYWYVFGNVT